MGHEAQATTISAGTLVRGEITSEEDLTIEGRVEGSITAQGVVTIAETAEVLSNVSASDVVVLGSLEGDLVASGTVEIGHGGRVEGDIKAGRVILSEGAVFRGSIDMGGEPDKTRKASPHRAARHGAETSKARHPAERPQERYAAERPRRPSVPLAPSAPMVTIPARAPHTTRSEPQAAEAVVPLRAPEPKVRGVGRTTALKK